MKKNKLVGIDVSTIIELFNEQKIASIECGIFPNLLEGAENYEAFKKSGAYEALMDALDKYTETPVGDTWFGYSKADPTIVAILERKYEAPANEDEIALTAVIHGDITDWS